MHELTLFPVAVIENDYKEKFGIPRQSGLAPHLVSRIVPLGKYANEEAFKEIEGYDYLWLIFGFSENDREHEEALTVRPPKLGGNERVGVFASRSPYRPNPIGLSCVRLERVMKEDHKAILIVSGADLMNGTPVYDIKPYVPYADSHPEARAGFSVAPSAARKKVILDTAFPPEMTEAQQLSLIESLGHDPRPGYHHDETRIYGMRFGSWNVRFKQDQETITILFFDPIL